MIVLGLDTSRAACTAALIKSGEVMAQQSDSIGKGHAEHIAPMVHELLLQQRVKVSDIDKICICTGPGSFIGLRIGMAFAKGLSLPYDISLVGLNAFSLWAVQLDPKREKRLVAIVPMGRGEICWAAIFHGQMQHPPVCERESTARTSIQRLAPDLIVEDAPVCGVTLARCGLSLNPQDAPLKPFYGRAPDARLPKHHASPTAYT